MAVLHPGGRNIVAGAVAGLMVALDARTLYLKDSAYLAAPSLNLKYSEI